MIENNKMSEPDLFRDTRVRYLGYANEVGEAFRSVVPRAVVRASYQVAFAYVVADTLSKSWKVAKKDQSPKKVVITAVDCLLWQTLASVVIPGFTINRICHYSNKALAARPKQVPPRFRPALVVVIGLASIPLIIHPIDFGTTIFMNYTFRQMFKA